MSFKRAEHYFQQKELYIGNVQLARAPLSAAGMFVVLFQCSPFSSL